MVLDQPILVELQEKDKNRTYSISRFESIKEAKRIKVSRSGTLDFFDDSKHKN